MAIVNRLLGWEGPSARGAGLASTKCEANLRVARHCTEPLNPSKACPGNIALLKGSTGGGVSLISARDFLRRHFSQVMFGDQGLDASILQTSETCVL